MSTNKEIDKLESILQICLQNQKISQRVKELNLTKKQQLEAIPIMLQMLNEEKQNNQNAVHETSFHLTQYGKVIPAFTLTEKGKKQKYLENIVTNEFFPFQMNENERIKQPKERKEIIDWMTNFFKNNVLGAKGVYLSGRSGIGKTWLFKKFAQKLASKGYSIGFVNVPSLSRVIKNNLDSKENNQQLIQVLQTCQILFLDDIGGENISFWFRDEILSGIINYRKENNLTTFFNSNFNLKELLLIQSQSSKATFLDQKKSAIFMDKIKYLIDKEISIN